MFHLSKGGGSFGSLFRDGAARSKRKRASDSKRRRIGRSWFAPDAQRGRRVGLRPEYAAAHRVEGQSQQLQLQTLAEIKEGVIAGRALHASLVAVGTGLAQRFAALERIVNPRIISQ
jgi:hypothetical protein